MIRVLFIIIVESVKSTNSLSVVLFIITPVIPVRDDWLAFTVPMSLGVLNEYKRTPSAIHLTDTGVDSKRVQVNSTMSLGHGFSWLILHAVVDVSKLIAMIHSHIYSVASMSPTYSCCQKLYNNIITVLYR